MGFLPLRLSIKFIISAQRTGFRFLLLTKGSGSVRCLPLWGRWREAPEGLTDRTKPSHSARRRAVKTFKSAKGVWGKTRVFPHKQHIKSSRDYPPKQSGGLFRKHTTPLNYSFLSQAAFRLQTPIYLTIHRPNFYSLELLKNSQHHRINHKARCKLPMKRSDHHADQN